MVSHSKKPGKSALGLAALVAATPVLFSSSNYAGEGNAGFDDIVETSSYSAAANPAACTAMHGPGLHSHTTDNPQGPGRWYMVSSIPNWISAPNLTMYAESTKVVDTVIFDNCDSDCPKDVTHENEVIVREELTRHVSGKASRTLAVAIGNAAVGEAAMKAHVEVEGGYENLGGLTERVEITVAYEVAPRSKSDIRTLVTQYSAGVLVEGADVKIRCFRPHDNYHVTLCNASTGTANGRGIDGKEYDFNDIPCLDSDDGGIFGGESGCPDK